MDGVLDFKDSCTIWPTTADAYGKDVLGTPATVACLYQQNTTYQHSASQDAIGGTSRLVLPASDPFVLSHDYRLEEMIVEINPFGASAQTQTFKISDVTVGRDVLLNDEVKHVECQLQKIEVNASVS